GGKRFPFRKLLNQWLKHRASIGRQRFEQSGKSVSPARLRACGSGDGDTNSQQRERGNKTSERGGSHARWNGDRWRSAFLHDGGRIFGCIQFFLLCCDGLSNGRKNFSGRLKFLLCEPELS